MALVQEGRSWASKNPGTRFGAALIQLQQAIQELTTPEQGPEPAPPFMRTGDD